MSHWTRNAPLAAIRPDVDREDLVEQAENAGGRPVCYWRGNVHLEDAKLMQVCRDTTTKLLA